MITLGEHGQGKEETDQRGPGAGRPHRQPPPGQGQPGPGQGQAHHPRQPDRGGGRQ